MGKDGKKKNVTVIKCIKSSKTLAKTGSNAGVVGGIAALTLAGGAALVLGQRRKKN